MLLSELTNELEILNGKIKQLIRNVNFEYDCWPEWSDMEKMGCDMCNPDNLQLISEYRKMLSKLAEVSQGIEYFKKPIIHEGVLHLNGNKRFEFDGVELTCGMGVEVLVQDYPEDSPEWVASSIEADNGCYYLVARPKLDLEGKKARMRKQSF